MLITVHVKVSRNTASQITHGPQGALLRCGSADQEEAAILLLALFPFIKTQASLHGHFHLSDTETGKSSFQSIGERNDLMVLLLLLFVSFFVCFDVIFSL